MQARRADDCEQGNRVYRTAISDLPLIVSSVSSRDARMGAKDRYDTGAAADQRHRRARSGKVAAGLPTPGEGGGAAEQRSGARNGQAQSHRAAQPLPGPAAGPHEMVEAYEPRAPRKGRLDADLK